MKVPRFVVGVIAGLLLSASAMAVEIPLKSGKTVEASSYKITGSYLMVTLPNGQRVAYDIADVDLEALRSAEAASSEGPPKAVPPETKPPSIMDALAPEDRPRSVVTIADGDVAPARPEEEGAGPEPAAGPPAGYSEGDGVVVDRLRIEPVDEGIWDIRGVIANRGSVPARDVRVQIEVTTATGEALASPTLQLAPELGVGETAAFSHHVETKEQPAAKVRVFWLQSTTPAAPAAGPGAAGGAGQASGTGAPRGGPQPTPRPSPIY